MDDDDDDDDEEEEEEEKDEIRPCELIVLLVTVSHIFFAFLDLVYWLIRLICLVTRKLRF